MSTAVARISSYGVAKVNEGLERIRPLCRVSSPLLVTACRQVGLPIDVALVAAGLLASVVDDLITVSKLPKHDFERSKRLERILAATEEPAASALRLAMAASPTNGRAAARHWDAICDKGERGKLAWLLGMQTDAAYNYSKKVLKRA